MKIIVNYKGLNPIEFEYNDILEINEIEFEETKNILIKLKDNKQVFLPISKEEFEKKINESQSTDIVFEFEI